MKTPEDIKKGLRRCEGKSQCDWCSLIRECEEDEAALAYIEQLEAAVEFYSNTTQMLDAKIEKLESRLAQVERERDAAVHDVRSLCATNYFSGDYCEYCKYREPDGQCFHDCIPYSNEWGWEWRGICPENTKEE